ncbi:MAG: DNA polymerase III subunit [Nitrospirota bacterium]
MALSEVIGQDKAVSILIRTLQRGRMSSAYLFAGESGIGKRLTALNLAKAINCIRKDDDTGLPDPGFDSGPLSRSDKQQAGLNPELTSLDACDVCESCRKIESNKHPDVSVIGPEKGEIRVEEIRAIEDALSYMPYEGNRKVVIIDEADSMNPSAANAFLKTLEEPPDKSLLILIAASPYRLPETIISRCSRINFALLSEEACKKVIEKGIGMPSSRSTKHPNEGPDPDTLVRLCMGRPGLALSSDRLSYGARFVELLKSMLNNGSEVWSDREEIEKWLDMAVIFMRDIVMLKIRGDREILLNNDIIEYISGIDKTSDIKGIISGYTKIALLKRKLDFNLNKAITWNYTASVMKTVVAGN